MHRDIDQSELRAIEHDLLLEAIYRRYGYDFRCYARASIERRVASFLAVSGCGTVGELIPKILSNREVFTRLLGHLSVAVTELFRDPVVYRAVREQVVPLLRSWPRVKVWHAGCATGEEVYSLAILLKEEGIYGRSTIHATDFCDDALDKARAGIYHPSRLKDATRNYQRSGGKGSFSEYYLARYEAAVMDQSLKENLLFSNHNLAMDGVFGEMQLVFCRNVLIYFNQELQDRVLRLITDSLVNGGFLCLGSKENLRFSAVSDDYEVVDEAARIYKKRFRPGGDTP